MILAIINGLLASIALETVIMLKKWGEACHQIGTRSC